MEDCPVLSLHKPSTLEDGRIVRPSGLPTGSGRGGGTSSSDAPVGSCQPLPSSTPFPMARDTGTLALGRILSDKMGAFGCLPLELQAAALRFSAKNHRPNGPARETPRTTRSWVPQFLHSRSRLPSLCESGCVHVCTCTHTCMCRRKGCWEALLHHLPRIQGVHGTRP